MYLSSWIAPFGTSTPAGGSLQLTRTRSGLIGAAKLGKSFLSEFHFDAVLLRKSRRLSL